jgi:hypothetical protein
MLHSMPMLHSKSMLHVHVFVQVHVEMPDCPASGQFGTRLKQLTMPEQVRYRTKLNQSGIFLVRYRTKIHNAGMPMPALVYSMPMPSYVYLSSAIHERDSRSWRPWNGRSHGEGCGRPMGRSMRPRSYGPSCLDTVKQEPRSQQREER